MARSVCVCVCGRGVVGTEAHQTRRPRNRPVGAHTPLFFVSRPPPHTQGETRMLMTKIPHFREVMVCSFECPHCGNRCVGGEKRH